MLTEAAKIDFNDADFNAGSVTFSYKSKLLKETFNLKIENDFLLEEFNAVKSYFPKAFDGNKKFSINIIFTLTNGVVSEIETSSNEIESINETIIDSIKHRQIENLTATPLRKSVDKFLFTADEIFDSFNEELNNSGNIFKLPKKTFSIP